jgi:hypothetical protein
MADNIFRSYRGRDPAEREEYDPSAEAGDPLAELARLIGRSVPRGEARDERYASGSADEPAAAGLDWAADESYAPERGSDEDRYAPPLADSQSSYPHQDRGYADEPTIGRFFSGSAPRFSEDAADDSGYQDEREPDLLGQRSANFPRGGSDDRYEAEDQQYDETYTAPAYGDASNRGRRGGVVVVVAVLALAVLGTAGAFGYRAMFGGSVLPTLPPIIKPANGPNKIMPSYGDAQASNSSQAGAADTSSSEKLVSHEEQPVDMQAPRAAPRIVSTIPIPPNQDMPAPGMAAPPAPLSTGPVPTGPAPVAAAPAPVAALPPTAPPAPPAATGPSGPKKVHTVIIRADQPANADAAASAPAPAPAPHSAPRVAAPAPKSGKTPAGANQPLSLVPGPQGDASTPAPAPRMRVTAAPPPPPAAAAAEPAPAAEAAPSSGGRYSVQVSSQRSEADAQAAFRALQAKFPNQLGGREAIVRRADLGAKGTYYRALVGPFASAEEAASMCSALKAAGGNCLVQRN